MLTGESGSGKTEAGKLVLQYIAAVTGHAQVLDDEYSYFSRYQCLSKDQYLSGSFSFVKC